MRSYVYGQVRETKRSVIYVVRVQDDTIDPLEADEIAERMRERIEARGEIAADVMVVEGARKETLRRYGTPYAVNRVRAALFNAAVSWTPIEFD